MKLFRHLIAIVLAAHLGLWGQSPARAAATLLPNGEQCFQALTGTTGMVGLLGTITGGSGGTSGTYGGVALTGGTGTGATANITVSGGAVTAVAILNPGTAYVVGDVLSAAAVNIGSTTGFSVPVSSISINSSLAGGRVYFYIPSTSTLKQTWFNADQSAAHQNTNPVALDANGCAVIYGIGSYRQVVQDSLGNTVWDKITTDTSANNNTFWAGTAGGTPNVITVVDPGFNATDGSIINFTALATNTGSATLNPSSFGAIPVLKDTTAGPVSLTGGEITQTNPISVIFRASDNAFHLLNPPILSASGSTAPLCGATGLRIVNNSSAPNTSVDITIGNVVMLTSAGAAINRSNASVTINFQVNGANGLDTGTIANTSFYYIWMIDNGAAPAGLASLSSTAPTLPAGYTYKCRMAAIPTNGSAHLLSFITTGTRTTLLTSSTVTGVAGTCVSAFAAVAWTSQVPPTATQFLGSVLVAPTFQAYIARATTGAIVAGSQNVAAQTTVLFFETPLLTAQTTYWCSDSTNNSQNLLGWIDAVNAN